MLSGPAALERTVLPEDDVVVDVVERGERRTDRASSPPESSCAQWSTNTTRLPWSAMLARLVYERRQSRTAANSRARSPQWGFDRL